MFYLLEKFLPTPSARRATCGQKLPFSRGPDFYPRPPRGGRPGDGNQGLGKYVISTHALREEGDVQRRFTGRRAIISTHALREEGDRGGVNGV